MEEYNDMAMDAFAFLELSEANVSMSADAEAWDTARGHHHEVVSTGEALLDEVLDEATLLA